MSSLKPPRNGVLCLFSHQGRILLLRTTSPRTGEDLHRPLGARIGPRQSAEEALAHSVERQTGLAVDEESLQGVAMLRGSGDGEEAEVLAVLDGRFLLPRTRRSAGVAVWDRQGRVRVAQWVRIEDVLDGRVRVAPAALVQVLGDLWKV